jgi:hypothetical protein
MLQIVMSWLASGGARRGVLCPRGHLQQIDIMRNVEEVCLACGHK